MNDHMLIQVEKVDLVSACKILDDAALNVPTHRPIVMRINVPHAEQIDSNMFFGRFVKWRNIKQEDFKRFAIV